MNSQFNLNPNKSRVKIIKYKPCAKPYYLYEVDSHNNPPRQILFSMKRKITSLREIK